MTSTRNHPRRNVEAGRRVCVIGAGFSGLGVAHALQRDGIAFDVVESTDAVGGNWSHGVYDSSHLISSKRSTAYLEYPMPKEWATFAPRENMRAYFDSYADHFDLRRHIEFGKHVTRLEPVGPDGRDGWTVDFADGDRRTYDAVVVANGHDWSPHVPTYPGSFTGEQLHSKEYFRPGDVKGARVLVVGAGNSAVDIAVELSATREVEVSMRRTYWFLPKTIGGVPTAELDKWYIPEWLQRPMMKLALRIHPGPMSRYGLPAPRHDMFATSPTVNETFLAALRHGDLRYRPGIDRLDGDTVHFTDGTSGQYDTIVWGTGFHVDFPFLDEKHVPRGDDGKPVLVARMAPANDLRNLYLFGVIFPRTGGGPLISRACHVLTRAIEWQWLVDYPISRKIGIIQKPTSQMTIGAGHLIRRLWIGRKYVDLRLRLARAGR